MMIFHRAYKSFLFGLLGLLASPLSVSADFSSLNMGMDYTLKGVSITNNDLDNATNDNLNYYSQNAHFYMTSWLNQDVEAGLRLQSINIWGLEGSTTPLTRYPKADGTPFVEEAYVHLPHVAWKRINLFIGRQHIIIGDGMIVSDDKLGFNAIRAQVDLPWKFDLDLFTAKMAESLAGHSDSDLNGAVLGTDREHNRWELTWVQESHKNGSSYILPTATTTASSVVRQYYDLRLFGNLKDAYYKLEYAVQAGEATLAPGNPVNKMKLAGHGEKLELGAQTDNMKWGRFGVRAIYAMGTGDDAGTKSRDEAFRPSFARRWDGLQRVGYGALFAANLSDAYERNAPFSPTGTGLPIGISGIKTMGLGIYSTQGVSWTSAIDYFIYNSLTKPTGKNDLGAELDGNVVYRYTGFVTFRLGVAYFFPGQVYGNLASRASEYTIEAHVHF